MAAPASVESKRSWRSAQSGTLVRRSRHLWRWVLSGLALLLIVLAVVRAWPRPLPQTMLLVLSSPREERTLPLVPFVEDDCSALLEWAHGAKVPAYEGQLSEINSPRDFVRRLAADANPEHRFHFKLEGHKSEL